MQEERREAELCRSVFRGRDEAEIIRGLTERWIALIDRCEAGETTGRSGASGEA